MLIQDIKPRTGLDRLFYPVENSLAKLTILTGTKRTIVVHTREQSTKCDFCGQEAPLAEYPTCEKCNQEMEQDDER